MVASFFIALLRNFKAGEEKMQSLWYILLVGVVLSVDAFTVGVTNGITESKMGLKKVFLIAFFYGAFQFMMPVIGYYLGDLLSFFIEKVSHWVAFTLLLIVGGKMIIDSVREIVADKKGGKEEKKESVLTVGKLAMQAVATSIDALAIGVTMLACETEGELYLNVWADSAIIGCTTFILCTIAVLLGKFAGDKIKVPAVAQIVGGAVLILLGLKILLQGLGVINLSF